MRGTVSEACRLPLRRDPSASLSRSIARDDRRISRTPGDEPSGRIVTVVGPAAERKDPS